MEVRRVEDCIAEVRPVEARPGKVRPEEVRLNITIRFPPLIPGRDPLL
jgi:hypothetical protein